MNTNTPLPNRLPIQVTAVVLLLALYLFGTYRQAIDVNVDMQRHDQSAYLQLAQQMRESDYKLFIGRNRMPVYPFIQSLFYRPELSVEANFTRGKWVNIGLSLLLLPGIYLLLRRYLRRGTAVLLFLVVTFTVFIFKAAYVQVELLFYFLNFVLFLALVRLLLVPDWRLAFISGGLMGLTYLTKAAVLPSLILFLFCTLLQGFCYLRRRQRKEAWNQIFSGLILLLAFILLTSPYIINSKRVFGRYFYNVNTTFYIWYDSWEEVEAGTKLNNDRWQWPDIPPAELPTAKNYLRTHSFADILYRLRFGFLGVLGNMLYAYGYFKYGMIVGILLAAVLVVNHPAAGQLIRSKPIVIFFLGAYFCGYFLSYVWYGPIMPGNRLILAQFLPFMFSAVYGLEKYFAPYLHVPLRRGSSRIYNLGAFFFSVTAVLFAVDLYYIFSERILTLWGGS